MDTVIRNEKAGKAQLYLDPRTKLLLCVTVSIVMFAKDNTGIFRYIIPFMVVIPLLFVAIAKSPCMAIGYGIMYIIALKVPVMLVPYLPKAVNVLFTGVIVTMTKLIPGMSMFIFLISTTSVSEFIAAMEKMKVPKIFIVPTSVMFRFFPTIIEEYGSIKDAMSLREVGNFRNPVQMLEYRMIPLLISLTSIGNELSISALTRGLDAPGKRTNMCAIGFCIQDYIAIFISAALLILMVIALIWGI